MHEKRRELPDYYLKVYVIFCKLRFYMGNIKTLICFRFTERRASTESPGSKSGDNDAEIPGPS